MEEKLWINSPLSKNGQRLKSYFIFKSKQKVSFLKLNSNNNTHWRRAFRSLLSLDNFSGHYKDPKKEIFNINSKAS